MLKAAIQKYGFIVILSLYCHDSLFSQTFPDTIDVRSRKVILNQDRTWEFLIPSDSPQSYVYREYWDTAHVFPYTGEKNKADSNIVTYLDSYHYKGLCPVRGKIYSLFTATHPGIDIALKKGDTIRSYYRGKVRFASFHKNGYGNLVIIRHPNGLETFYAHLSLILADTNQWLEAGSVIGLGGSTGRSNAPHLHFETRYHDIPLNPFHFIDQSLFSFYVSQEKPLKKENKTVKNAVRVYHKIKKGDTLYNISKRYGTSIDKICWINNITINTIMHPGDSICVKKGH